MTHIQSRSYNIDGKEVLFDKRGKKLGEYKTIDEANNAAKVISATSDARPRKKPIFPKKPGLPKHMFGSDALKEY